MFACVVFVWGHFSEKAFVVLVIGGTTKRALERAGMHVHFPKLIIFRDCNMVK